jgi:GH35 family endo-1,4-beta-xylanase
LTQYEAKSAKIEPQEFEWKTSPVDTIVSYTKQHGLGFKFHALYWEQDLAPYFQNLNGRPDALKAAMLEHTKTIMQRYGNNAVMIDVVSQS